MIDTLRVKRFKSIRELSLNCKKINIFIGEPNTGKSNILETLGMFSYLHYHLYGAVAKQFVRFERTSNLFHDESLDDPFEIFCDDTSLRLEFSNGRFQGRSDDGEAGELIAGFGGDHNDLSVTSPGTTEKLTQFKFYRFSVQQEFPLRQPEFLIPPSGKNLLSVLMANRELKSVVNQPFSSMGLRLGIRPQEGKLEVLKESEDVIVSYPYSLASETLQRLTFYIAAIMSNKQSVLVFEEPESHAFPYYTKYLAELIALDQNENQYFISTHNPYFLLPVLEKVSKENISVNVVYFENYETKVKKLTQKELTELGEIDVFSNLDRYIPGR